MSTGLMIAGGVVLLLVVVPYLWYISLIKRRNTALEALSGIDVQLQKRSDLIPNILTIAQKFMEHERELISEVVRLREQAEQTYDRKDADAVRSHLQVASGLGDQLGQLMVRLEAYPELTSGETMVTAQRTYNEVEAQISAARRFYNSAVNALNTSAQIFPGNLIASMAGVTEMPSFEAADQARKPVDASSILK